MKQALKSWPFFRRRPIFSRSKKSRLPSLLKVMTALVPRKVIKETLSSTQDRRQWGVLAAAWVGVSEREFFEAAAAEMKVPFLAQPPTPDLAVFGPNAGRIIQELRRLGASVLLAEAHIKTFVCVDPSELGSSFLYTGGEEIALSGWSEIARALDASERALREAEAQGVSDGNNRKRELCLTALEILMHEAKSLGACTFDIITSEGKTRYQFYASSGKLAVGGVHPEVVGDLLSLLRNADGSVITLKEGVKALVRGYGGLGDFRISVPDAADPSLPREEACHREVPQPAVAASTPTPRVLRDRADSEGQEVPRSDSGEPVLIVDDNPMFCRILQKLLSRDGFAPAFAGNGVEALEKLAEADTIVPKIIVCDLHMPIMNGREFISRLKNDVRFKDIPIVVLTSDDDVEAELQLLRSGAETLISKAKDPRVLTSHLKRLARVSALREAA